VLATVLVVLLIAAGGRFLWPLLVGGDGGPSGLGPRGAPRSAAAQVTALATDSLAAEPRDYRPGRNPFLYGEPPPPPGPTPEEIAARAAAQAARRAAEEEARQRAEEQAAATPPEPPRPQPPAFRLSYLGSFGPKERRIAVFTDGQEIYNAVVGDVIADEFVVADIGYESVAIRYLDFPDEPARRVGIGS
jgi:hypothetical protein